LSMTGLMHTACQQRNIPLKQTSSNDQVLARRRAL
jgi:hypothetical protein